MRIENITTMKTQNNIVNWYQCENGNYEVSVIPEIESSLSSKLKWKFGTTSFCETISFYWFQQLVKLIENMQKYPEEVLPMLSKDEKQIIEMCKQAIYLRFNHK